MANQLILKKGLDAARTVITPAEGELVYATDTKKVFIGDGATAGGNAVDTNATHSGEVTGSGALTITQGAVTLAKMANGIAGNLIAFSAAGAPAAVATGSAGQVLTSNGAGTAPTMQTPAGGPTLYAEETTGGLAPTATSALGVAIGSDAKAITGTRTLAVGHNSTSSGTDSVALGYLAKAINIGSTAINYSTAGGYASTSIGLYSVATAVYTLALGASCAAYGTRSCSVGYSSSAAGANAIAIGNTSDAPTTDTTAIGHSAKALSNYSIAIGSAATVDWAAGTAISLGYNSKSYGSGSMSLGAHSISNGAATIAIGQMAIATGTHSVSIGQYSQSPNTGEIVLHNGAYFAAAGDLRSFDMVLRQTTTSATPAILDCLGAGDIPKVQLNATTSFVILVTARRTDISGESAAYKFEGCIDNNAGTTAIVGTVTKTVVAKDNPAWDVGVTADDINAGISITVTGEALKTIRWGARVQMMEVSG